MLLQEAPHRLERPTGEIRVSGVEPEDLVGLSRSGVESLGMLAGDERVAGRIDEEQRSRGDPAHVEAGIEIGGPGMGPCEHEDRGAGSAVERAEWRAHDRPEAEPRIGASPGIDGLESPEGIQATAEVGDRLAEELARDAGSQRAAAGFEPEALPEEAPDLRARALAVEREIDARDRDAAARPGASDRIHVRRVLRPARPVLEQHDREWIASLGGQEQASGNAVASARELEGERPKPAMVRERSAGLRPHAQRLARVGRDENRIHARSLARQQDPAGAVEV